MLDDWVEHGRTGWVEIHFYGGEIRWADRKDRWHPPPKYQKVETASRRLLCPTCQVPFSREHDYGAKWDCGKCGVTWDIWDITKADDSARAGKS